MSTTIGSRFAEALAAKDFDTVASLVNPEISFKALTPGKHWDASNPAEVIEVLKQWFEPKDEIRELIDSSAGAVGDRPHVSYRFLVSNPDGDFHVEQHMYYEHDENTITMMRILCSGFRPPDP